VKRRGTAFERLLYAVTLCGDTIDTEEAVSAILLGKRWAIADLSRKLTVLRQQQIDTERTARQESRKAAKEHRLGVGRGGHKAVRVSAIAFLAAEMVGRCAVGRFTMPAELGDLLRLHLGGNTFTVPKTWGDDLYDRALRYCIDHPLTTARALGRYLGVHHTTAGERLLKLPEFRREVEAAGGKLWPLPGDYLRKLGG
jgi:hypothetical protein